MSDTVVACYALNPSEGIPKGKLAFSTPKGQHGPAFELWANLNAAERAPDFDGTLDGQRVVAYLRNGKRGAFMAVYSTQAGENGRLPQKAKAQVVTNSAGVPKLAMSMQNTTVWAEVARQTPTALLVLAGLDVAKQEARQAAHRAKATPSQTAEEAI